MILTPTMKVNIADRFTIGGNGRFVLLAGPCVIEDEKTTLTTAESLKRICERLGLNLVFKSSFDKANRSSVSSSRGVGLEQGLKVLQRVKTEFDLPIVTDVNEAWQCNEVANVADVVQIPAFLARQTDLLVAAARTNRVVNVKKGQFMAPWDMKNVVEKIRSVGNDKVLLCERGTTFGYNNLVVDMTGLLDMRSLGVPVVFDATHSVQKPSGQGDCSGGNRAAIPYLLRAAVAVGVDAVFAEVHPNPDKAYSDAASQLPLSSLEEVLKPAIEIDNIIKKI
jgi:2-dehydro-3-deoxyphosphooctonate aldolase (KDO 8-P synthase)